MFRDGIMHWFMFFRVLLGISVSDHTFRFRMEQCLICLYIYIYIYREREGCKVLGFRLFPEFPRPELILGLRVWGFKA